MQTRLFTPIFAGLLAASLAGCGDDKGGSTGSETDPTTTGTPNTTGTGDTPTSTTDEETTATTVDPSVPTTTTVDPDTTATTDPTTGEPADCVAPADEADEDADGVANSADNCRCDANPNQLDFDGNAVGNVCDAPLVFTIADGVPPEFNKLDTTANAEMTLSCEFPVSLIVLNGNVQVTLDDAGQAKIWAARLNFADTPELECDLTLLKVKLRIEKFFAEGPDAFAVGFPFTVPDHDAGTVSGQTDTPQNILVSGIINVTESSNEALAMPGENPLEMVPGAFPTGFASVVNNDKQVSLVFDDSDSVVFMQTTMSGINIKLSGLKGTLRLKM
jgi:hypothetical protein